MNTNSTTAHQQPTVKTGPVLNVYPDSLGGTLRNVAVFLTIPDCADIFETLYVLPTLFNTDLDRGFSVIDYELNETIASTKDLNHIKETGISLKLDFILNHLSVGSKQFQDILKNGEHSKFKNFFINWNTFWEGCGHMTSEGYIQPDHNLIKEMFFRKPGLPILQVYMPDGKQVPYWNTFNKEIHYATIDTKDLVNDLGIQSASAEKLANIVNNSLAKGIKPANIEFEMFIDYREKVIRILEKNREYLGQIDLNVASPLVWEFYDNTLKKLAQYGAEIVRLDAFAYVSKEPGKKNFFNEPDTWDFLERLRTLADKYDVQLLPEIHSKYSEKIHEKIADKGYLTYDFFLPGLIIDAFERKTNEALLLWINDIQKKNIRTVTMLGCHDGIPLLDLKGLVPDEHIDNIIATVIQRGGYVKDLHGEKNIYYQVNATYFSALGEDEKKLLLARAIQMFMPGIPQIWYLDLFAGTNDHEAVKKAGPDGHKEINRTNLTLDQIQEGLKLKVVQEQLALLRLRNTFPAFGFDAQLEVVESASHIVKLRWKNNGHSATLEADLNDYQYKIVATDNMGYAMDLISL